MRDADITTAPLHSPQVPLSCERAHPQDACLRFRVPDPIVECLRSASDAERAEISRWLLDHFDAGLAQGMRYAAAMHKAATPLSHAERLAARDAAIRAALRHYDGPPTVRAKALAADLALATNLLTAASSEKLRAAREVLRLNDGASLGWRQIANISDGWRS